jgi:outer membrane protein
VQRDNQYPIVKDANNARAIAYLRLAGIANLPVNAAIKLTTPLLDLAGLPPDPFAVLDTTGIVASALGNAGLTALEEEMTARQLAVTAAGRTAWPALSVFANYSKQAFPGDWSPMRDDWRTDASAGVSMNWNIFDGLQTRGAVNQARAEYVRTTQSLQQERELVQLQVAREIGELGRAAEELRSRTRTVQVAQRALDLATLRYDEGASSLLEVEDARVAFQVSQLSEARARHDYYLALAHLERYSNQPLFTNLVQQMGGESQ